MTPFMNVIEGDGIDGHRLQSNPKHHLKSITKIFSIKEAIPNPVFNWNV